MQRQRTTVRRSAVTLRQSLMPTRGPGAVRTGSPDAGRARFCSHHHHQHRKSQLGPEAGAVGPCSVPVSILACPGTRRPGAVGKGALGRENSVPGCSEDGEPDPVACENVFIGKSWALPRASMAEPAPPKGAGASHTLPPPQGLGHLAAERCPLMKGRVQSEAALGRPLLCSF